MIITNSNSSHKKNLLALFEEADEIIFAVAFLKNSGINNIKANLKAFCEKKNTKSTFYIGTGLGETDPTSLEGLYRIIKSKPNHKLILCTPDAGIFHPKIYVFRKGLAVTVIIGSANLTEAGWIVNEEVSMINSINTNSIEYKQLIGYLDNLNKLYYTDDISGLILKYKLQLSEFKKDHPYKPIFRFKRKTTAITGIDMPRLYRYYEAYKNSEEFIDPDTREEHYLKARSNLEILASRKCLDKTEFHDLFGPLVGHAGYIKLWHSGSIHRKTHKTLEYADVFRELVREIKNNTIASVEDAFNKSINFLNIKRKSGEISGIGENIVAEIMMSFNFLKFGNLNKNPIEVLWILGAEFKEPSSFKGEDYGRYISLITKIKEKLEMRSFLEIDSFFNYVYWNLVEE